jgi:DNA-binding transcriptional MerR regulator/methylmalonyl-CoA mutase cobalamin-binding subunit
MSTTAWLSIAAIERDTGLSKDLLRVWERRYGFPQPERDAHGERLYPPDQLHRLRAIKRLLDAGLRPSQVVSLETPALEERLQQLRPAERTYEASVDLDALLQPLLAHDATALHAALQAELLRRGLGPYVIDLLAPMVRKVGELWAEGRVQIHEEHLFTEAVQQQLHRAIASLSVPDTAQPRVLLSTLPGEEHGLGLLMVHTLLSLENCACVSLGVQTPAAELARAAERQRADVLALSCSAYARNAGLQQDILRLRDMLPSGTALWLGGSAPALRRLPSSPGLWVIDSLQGIAPAVARWRAG